MSGSVCEEFAVTWSDPVKLGVLFVVGCCDAGHMGAMAARIHHD